MENEEKVYTREESLELFVKEYEDIKKQHSENYNAMTEFKKANPEFWEIRLDEEKSKAPEFEEAKKEHQKLTSELREIKKRRGYLESEIRDMANDAFQDMTEEVLKLQDDIEEKKKQIQQCDELIASMEESLKEYADDESHSELVKNNIEEAKETKEKLVAALKEYEAKLKELNINIDDFVKKYARIINKNSKKKETPKKEESNKEENKEEQSQEENKVEEEQKESNEEKEEEKETKPKRGKNNNNVVYIDPNTIPSTDTQPVQQTSNEKIDKTEEGPTADIKRQKRIVDHLAYKAKNGELSADEKSQIAELMKDPSKYKEIGITTGLFNNKAKTFLSVMANDAISNSVETIRNIQKAIPDSDIKYEVKNDQDTVSLGALRTWGSGVKKMTTNPDVEIDAEEYFKKIVDSKALDNITEKVKVQKDGKEVEVDLKDVLYSDVENCLAQYATLKNASKGYRTAVQERKQAGLFGGMFGKSSKDVKPLPSAQEVTSSSKSDITETLKGQTVENPVYTENVSKETRENNSRDTI